MNEASNVTSIEGAAENAAAEMGGNLTELKLAIGAAAQKYEKLRADRAAVNADINKLKSDLEAQGVPRRVFERCFQDYLSAQTEDGGEKVREQRQAESIVREALGLEQFELFGGGSAPAAS